MATINYNGMELEEFTSDKPVIFDPLKKMAVTDDYDCKDCRVTEIIIYDPRRTVCKAIGIHNQSWRYCFLLPDPPKPRRATNRELSKWLAQGNGQIQYDDKTKNFGKSPDGERHKALKSTTIFEYFGADDFYVGVDIQVRKWSDTEWHEPTVDYLFGE